MTRNRLILAELMRRQGKWVPMTLLAKIGRCFAVHSRISDIREMGFDVRNKIEWRGREAFSFYQLK